MEIKVYLLQRPHIEVDGREALAKLNHKELAMIFYLAARKGQMVSKELLSEIFWPELPEENARSNLRQSLSYIRKICAEEWGGQEEASIIFSERNMCSLNASLGVFVDVAEFRKALKAASVCDSMQEKIRHLQHAVNVHGGSFLDGISVRGSVAFEEWVMMERESVNQAFIDVSKQLAFLYRENGQFAQGISCLKKLLLMDPLLEEVHLQLMELYCQNQERAKAICQYKECVRILGEELNIGPMEETRVLYRKILEDAPVEMGHIAIVEEKEELCVLQLYTASAQPIDFEGIYRMLESIIEEDVKVPTYLKPGLAMLFPQYSEWLAAQNLSESYLFYCIKKLLQEISLKGKVEIQVPHPKRLDQKSAQLLQYLIGNLHMADVDIHMFKEE